nr:carboxypeptidase-like regulatory domain-containing protein [Prevotella sp. 10(H)]
MKNTVRNTLHRFSACLLLLITVTSLQAQDGRVLDRIVELSKSKGTIYQLLKEVSGQSGYLFIYDSQVIDNDKTVKIRKGKYTLRQAIYTITDNNQLQIDIIGNHILLRKEAVKKESRPVRQQIQLPLKDTSYFTISGKIYDRITDDPIVYGSISLNYTTIGTVTNQNGEFRLNIPDSLRNGIVKFSHIGYQTQEIEAGLLDGQHINLSIDPQIISLQEVVIRVVDPREAIKDMLEKREINYSDKPARITAFYREGTDHKKKNLDLTESVVEVYKTGYNNEAQNDQTKLIKMRRIVNKQLDDTLFTKMKSGLYSTFVLDIIRDLPDFLALEEHAPYMYTHSDITMIDDRRVNVISFEQTKHTKAPMMKGELFIDAENSALLEARFEINPKHTEKATHWFIEKSSPKIRMTLQEAKYIVSYRQSDNGKYYINHVRGDLHFKARIKGKWFSSPLHLWFEMVNCKTETGDNIKGFGRKERLSPHKIFSETKYKYDKSFWGNFNVILPEDKLKETILDRLNEVTETVGEE